MSYSASSRTDEYLPQMLRMPLTILPNLIVWILQTFVSINRIQTFLGEDEVPDAVSTFKRPVVTRAATQDDLEVSISGASFAWNKVDEVEDKKASDTTATATEDAEPERQFELKDINVKFPVGRLTIVAGPTASGKSGLLMALLGEMTVIEPPNADLATVVRLPKNPHQIDPATELQNSVSYCAQTPWLEQATIKQNILFYESLDEHRYQTVVKACALQPDLDMLEDGDETEIGARGVGLAEYFVPHETDTRCR